MSTATVLWLATAILVDGALGMQSISGIKAPRGIRPRGMEPPTPPPPPNPPHRPGVSPPPPLAPPVAAAFAAASADAAVLLAV